MICFPNAKINLGLNIVEKRPDGYHNIETVFYPIPIKDALEITEAPSTSFTQTGIPVDAPAEKNLVMKALRAIKQNYTVPERWIEDATQPQVLTPHGEITYGYGHQIWMTAREGAFLFNGAFGQYMLALPDQNALVVLFSGTSRLFAQGGVLDQVTAALDSAEREPLPPDPMGAEALHTTLSALSARYRAPFFNAAKGNVPLEEFISRLEGRVYLVDKNIGGIFPFILQSVHNNFTTGLDQIFFSRGEDGTLSIEMVEGEYKHCFSLCESGYSEAVFTQRGDVFEARLAAQTELSDTGELSLNIVAHFIETPFTRLMRVSLTGEDTIKIVFDENPSIRDASEMLMELTGMTRVEIVRNMLPLLKRERMQHTLRTFTTVTVQGKL